MKTLKKVGISLLGIIAIALITALFVSKDASYDKSIIINAPVEVVWQHVATFEAQGKWSPWSVYDPEIKQELIGIDGAVGAKQSWESEHEKVGKGEQTIFNMVPNSIIETDLKFYVPYESEAKGFIKLELEGSGTKVTWGFKSVMPYPFNLMKLFMDLDEMMEEDWNLGLNKLKELSED
ncbi:SRPBCC family protein [uncultured Lutibacter sp.]|uniref:SRPBCC family protein n=1 Tax=uncultured Lutibacter sp. TaxID=437739 RepID=UPI0026283A88|nr:SRPBCC family protein [uncultured Lutibacter sp.]